MIYITKLYTNKGYSKYIETNGDRISFYITDLMRGDECIANIIQKSDNTLYINGNISNIFNFILEFIEER